MTKPLPELPLDPVPPPNGIPPSTATPGTNTGRSAQRFEIANRRRQVAALVLARVDERTIARHLGVSLGKVRSDKGALYARWTESAQRDVSIARAEAAAALDADEVTLRGMLDGLTDVEAKLEVWDRVLKIQERRARLLGLDAPERKEIVLPGWQAGSVVRDEPLPLERAVAVLAVLREIGALEALASRPVLDAVPAGDPVAPGNGAPPPTDPVRSD